jgi:hypothetical protein
MLHRVATERTPSKADEREAKKLIAAALAAFAFSATQRRKLALAIYAARIAAYAAAYLASAQSAGAALPDDWEPSNDALRRQRDAAHTSATFVAATYASDLSNQASGFVTSWLTDSGSMDGCAHALSTHLQSWANQRAQWKAQQVGGYETAQAQESGTGDFLRDLQAGNAVDAQGNPLDGNAYVVAVVPDSSSLDDCADYAGNTYPLDAYDDLPIPMHPYCIHEKVLMPADEAAGLAAEDEEESSA